jgi:glycosyltransferase involved in cell wall biosynthesis
MVVNCELSSQVSSSDDLLKGKFSSLNIGVVIPALNEEKNIEEVICKLRDFGYDNILVIDGKSKDNTAKVAAKLGAKVVTQEGHGKGGAIRQVLRNRYFDVDVLVLMDADGSMDPKEIPAFVDAMYSGADVVKGSRFLKGGYTYDMEGIRKFGNSMLMFCVNFLWSAKYTDLCYGYFAFNKNAVEQIAPLLESDGFEIETEIFIKALDLGLIVKEIPSTEFPRKYGESNLHSLRDGFKILKTILRNFLNSALSTSH